MSTRLSVCKMHSKILFLLPLPLHLKVGQVHGAYCNSSKKDCLETSRLPLPAEVLPSTSPPPQSFSEDDFSTLRLKPEQLRGSRWALERNGAEVVTVNFSMEVVDATLINKDELILRIEFNMRQSWMADGLQFPQGLFKDDDPPDAYVTAGEEVLANIWSPDSYISTSRESKLLIQGAPLALVYIFKNATIMYKVRMYTNVACSSNYQWYPLDIQNCDLTVESYKYQSDLVRYNWTGTDPHPPVVMHSRRLYQYHLQLQVQYDSGSLTRGATGMSFSYVRVRFTYDRRLGNNIIQAFIPTVLVVVLSWFSFWLGLDAIPGRVSLLVTCMFALVTMHSGTKSSIPPVHYLTMMDAWYISCMAFVFSAMSEFVAVKFLHRRYEQQGRTERRDEVRARLYSIFEQEHLPSPRLQPKFPETEKVVKDGFILQHKHEREDGGDKENGYVEEKPEPDELAHHPVPAWITMDKFSRGFFPLLFVIFNGVYWPLLFVGSGGQDHEVYTTTDLR